jgi:hypothetical protein
MLDGFLEIVHPFLDMVPAFTLFLQELVVHIYGVQRLYELELFIYDPRKCDD